MVTNIMTYYDDATSSNRCFYWSDSNNNTYKSGKTKKEAEFTGIEVTLLKNAFVYQLPIERTETNKKIVGNIKLNMNLSISYCQKWMFFSGMDEKKIKRYIDNLIGAFS